LKANEEEKEKIIEDLSGKSTEESQVNSKTSNACMHYSFY